MKRVVAFTLTCVLVAVGLICRAAPPIPQGPTEWVTDSTGFLSDSTAQTMNARLEALERTTGHQVLVWVGKTTGDTPLEDWTVRAFKEWRVGRKGLDLYSLLLDIDT